MRLSRATSPLFAALLCAALAPGCLAAEMPQFDLHIRDGHFSPARIEVPAGVKFRVVIHNLENVTEEFESYALNREKHIRPLEQVVIFLGPLTPGRYLYQGESRNSGSSALGVIEVR